MAESENKKKTEAKEETKQETVSSEPVVPTRVVVVPSDDYSVNEEASDENGGVRTAYLRW